MKTKIFATAVILATFFYAGGNASAARKITTVQGVLGKSSEGKTLLKTDGDKGYFFDPATEAGKKILSVCKSGKTCVVRGVVNGSYILNAYYVSIPE